MHFLTWDTSRRPASQTLAARLLVIDAEAVGDLTSRLLKERGTT